MRKCSSDKRKEMFSYLSSAVIFKRVSGARQEEKMIRGGGRFYIMHFQKRTKSQGKKIKSQTILKYISAYLKMSLKFILRLHYTIIHLNVDTKT